MSKKYFFGWSNIKKGLIEIIRIYSEKPSFFSKKRIESGIAFIVAEWGMIFYLLKKYPDLTMTDLIMWATIQFGISGYTATIADVRTLSQFNGVGINTAEATNLNASTTIGTNVSKTVIGSTINLTATTVNTLFGSQTSLYTQLIITGRDSGARITIPVTITKVTQ